MRQASPTGDPHEFLYRWTENSMIRNALFLAGRLYAYEPQPSEAVSDSEDVP